MLGFEATEKLLGFWGTGRLPGRVQATIRHWVTNRLVGYHVVQIRLEGLLLIKRLISYQEA